MTGTPVIRDLGQLDGDLLLFGGCYSNLQASVALIAAARQLGIPGARMICTGDVVAYCASGPETVALIRKSGCAVVAGNVERQLAASAPDCGCGFQPGTACDLLSVAWYAHAEKTSDAGMRSWMAGLPDAIVFRHNDRRYAVIHGGLSDISRFLWPNAPDSDLGGEIAVIEAALGPVDGVICGHSGIAFERMVGRVHWINAGAIGLPPHDGQPATRFMVLGDQGVRTERLHYDSGAAAAAMQAAGLTQGYHHALGAGFWPSEDILPPELRRQ